MITEARLSVPAISLAWLTRLRWGAALLQALTVGVAALGLHLSLSFAPLSVLIAITGVSNLVLEGWRRTASNVPSAIVPAVFVVDTLLLTGLLYFAGGPSNPFSILYLVHVTLAAVVLGIGWAGVIVVLSSACYGGLFFAHVPVPELAHHHVIGGMSLHLQGMWIAFSLAAAIIAYFVARVARALHERDRQLAEARDAAARAEKLASLTTLAAGAAHELGTPLGTIAVAAGELARALEKVPDAQELLADARLIRDQIARCRAILDQMSGRAGEAPGEAIAPHRIEDILAGVEAKLGDAERARVVVRMPEGETSMSAPPRALAQVLTNLVKNGLEASREPVEVEVRVTADRVTFAIRDRGDGIPADVLGRVGEPFFTTKPPGRGLGLGVFLARAFASRVGGTLRLSSAPGFGTTAVLELPRSIPAAHHGT